MKHGQKHLNNDAGFLNMACVMLAGIVAHSTNIRQHDNL